MRRVVLAGFALLLAACQDSLPTAPIDTPALLAGLGAPVQVTVQRVPIEFSVTGPCVNEAIAVSGSLNVTTSIWGNADALRIKSHLNGNLSGTGTLTGLTYRYLQVSNSDYVMETSTGASETDQTIMFRVVSSRAAPDFHMVMNGTYRYDPLWGTTFEPKRWDMVCR